MVTKKQKQRNGAIIILIAVALILAFGGKVFPLAMSPGGGGVEATSESFTSEDSQSVVLNVGFSLNNVFSKTHTCNGASTFSIVQNFDANPFNEAALPTYPEGVPENVWFDAEFVQFNGVKADTNPCSDIGTGATVVTDSTSGRCKIWKGVIVSGRQTAWYRCELQGTGHAEIGGEPVNAVFYGYSGGSARTILLKEGTECTQEQLINCESGEECINNLCQIPTINIYRLENSQCSPLEITPDLRTINDFDSSSECQNALLGLPINVYRFAENECLLTTTTMGERTELDFNSLEECQSNIVPPPIPIIPIIIGGGLVVGLIVYFIRKR